MIIFALLPISAFCLLFLFLLTRHPLNEPGGIYWQEPFLQTVLLWSAFFAVGTELLNLVGGLTTVGIVLLWMGALAGLGAVHWKYNFLAESWQRFKGLFSLRKLRWFDAVAWTIIIVTLLILLITGLMSPPNIHDVLAYHMARVMHWVQQGTLDFYPTSIPWQLWMPPFSEFSQLHWQLLTHGDSLASFHQWYYLVFIMVAVSAVSKLLGAQRRGQLLSAMFILTVPIVVLQASGAKNDIVLSFFIAAIMFYVVKAAKEELSMMDWIASGISVGLGLLTKGTFAVFALPLLLWLLISILRKSNWKKAAAYAATGLIIIVAMNGWHWLRNVQTFGSPSASQESSVLMNSRVGIKETLSNLSRNAVVQMNGKYGIINESVMIAMERIHEWLDLPVFDQAITYGPHEFYYVPTREEVAGNPFHFAAAAFLLPVCLLGLIRKESRSETLTVIILCSAGYAGAVLFSAVFRWQAWSTRFFIPYYVILAPVFGTVFGKLLRPFSSWLAGVALVMVLINPLLNNYSRSFSWSAENRNSIWRQSRKSLLFANNQNIEGAVLELTYWMEASQCREFGVIMRTNAPEYLLWATLNPHPRAYYLEHIRAANLTAKHASADFDPCGIVLFEVTYSSLVDETKFKLAQRIEVGGEYPFSLFLRPDFSSITLD
jgi:hypothetical protein